MAVLLERFVELAQPRERARNAQLRRGRGRIDPGRLAIGGQPEFRLSQLVLASGDLKLDFLLQLGRAAQLRLDQTKLRGRRLPMLLGQCDLGVEIVDRRLEMVVGRELAQCGDDLLAPGTSPVAIFSRPNSQSRFGSGEGVCFAPFSRQAIAWRGSFESNSTRARAR